MCLCVKVCLGGEPPERQHTAKRQLANTTHNTSPYGQCPTKYVISAEATQPRLKSVELATPTTAARRLKAAPFGWKVGEPSSGTTGSSSGIEVRARLDRRPYLSTVFEY